MQRNVCQANEFLEVLENMAMEEGVSFASFYYYHFINFDYLCIISIITPAGGEGSIIGLVSGSLIPNCVYQPLFTPHHLTVI